MTTQEKIDLLKIIGPFLDAVDNLSALYFHGIKDSAPEEDSPELQEQYLSRLESLRDFSLNQAQHKQRLITYLGIETS